jgi:DNA-directed RNA polymerase specialized sigma24 family protein
MMASLVLSKGIDVADELVQVARLARSNELIDSEAGTSLDQRRPDRRRPSRCERSAGRRSVWQKETNIFVSLVLTGVGRLIEIQREVVPLVYLEALNCAQAAQATGALMGTVMSRLAAARSAISKLEEI